MAVFDRATLRENWKIWQLLRYGPVTLFHNLQVLEETVRYLRQHDYVVHEFDCRSYQDEQAILTDVALRLGVLQDYDLNPNFAGFADYLGDVEVPAESGLVIVFQHFDSFHGKFAECAHSILDIIAHNYHQNLLFGLRFITLVQTDDPLFQIKPVGGFMAWWNDREGLIKSRTS